jgi:putative phosphoesterase
LIIGVLSDTHGNLHPRVIPLFREAGVEMVLHAGDVGEYTVIQALRQVAPVTAVCGNVDVEGRVALLPGEVHLEVEGVRIYMTHVGGKPGDWLKRLPQPLPQVAICGHSHKAFIERVGDTLLLNPGAAGVRPRFGAPLSVALLSLEVGKAEAELITL